ncbi:kinase-like domain-containing protein [Lipomyces oligophaga]|uniref:kinase-like domain-containing protein n=1 Tax=Lipomyces oligophaga TaxID=45792 RepID=UPI0034CF262C
MSTGLLSKRNRHSISSIGSSHLAPPDTPCKRPAQPQFAPPSSTLRVTNSRPSSYTSEDEAYDFNSLTRDYEAPLTPTKPSANSRESVSFDSIKTRSTPSQEWQFPTLLSTSSNAVASAQISGGLNVNTSFATAISPTAGSLLDIKTPSTPAKPAGYFDSTLTPSSSTDTFLLDRFDTVCSIGSGEFSAVFVVTESHNPQTKYAIKRSKKPVIGHKAFDRCLEEVAVLKDLASRTDNEDREYIINFIDSWEYQNYLYIMTDYCDNGSLDVFLAEQGSVTKLDQWRVWKILVEMALGIRFIHDAGYIHLDLKPANVFITFEGSLKIGDFGMATKLPVISGIEREGDREYIAPEVLASQKYSKPADIFSFGLIMLEIAANIVLPDNGAPWQKLRSGDLSDAGRLSSSSGELTAENPGDHGERSQIPAWAPEFMLEGADNLDQLVKWMLKPEPYERPTIEQIMSAAEVQLVDSRRKAGAIIFEGEYGPNPNNRDPDGNMLDQDDDWRMEL